MLSNHNPHYACKRFHHRRLNCFLMQKEEGGGKKLYWSFSIFLQGIPISPCSLSSTFVDKSHICVPFRRPSIVLNGQNFSPYGAAVHHTEVLVDRLDPVQDLASCCINLKHPVHPHNRVPSVRTATSYESWVHLHRITILPPLLYFERRHLPHPASCLRPHTHRRAAPCRALTWARICSRIPGGRGG